MTRRPMRRSDGKVVVIAHRGASAYAPEHTLAAYDLALQMGADYIEQDLQMTKEGALVVLHDATLDRTARGPVDRCTGLVSEKTLDEIRTCDVGRWFSETRPEGNTYDRERIPTLDQVFRRYAGRARFYIETKNPDDAPGMEEALVALLESYDLLAERTADLPVVIIQSFSADSLRKVRTLAPTLPLVQLFENLGSEAIRARLDDVSTYAGGIGPSRHSVDAALVEHAAHRNLVIHPYTVNKEADMRHLIKLGVNGVFTDRPDQLLRLR